MAASMLTSGSDHHPSRCYNSQCSLQPIEHPHHQFEVGSEELVVLHGEANATKDEECAKRCNNRYSSHYATTMTTTMMSTAMATSSPANKKEKRRCILSSQSNAAAAPCRRLFQEEHYHHVHSQQSSCRLSGAGDEAMEQVGSSSSPVCTLASEPMEGSLLLQSVCNDEHPMSDQLLGIAVEDEGDVPVQDAVAHRYAAEEAHAVVLTTDDEQANFDQHMPRVHDDCPATITGDGIPMDPSVSATMMDWSAATSITASVSSSHPITRPPSSTHMLIGDYHHHAHQWYGQQERYPLLTRSSPSFSAAAIMAATAKAKTKAKATTRQGRTSVLMPKEGRIAKCDAKMHKVDADAAAAVADEDAGECIGASQVFFFSQPAPSADPLPLLPCHSSPRDAIPRITPATMVDILDGCYAARFAATVIDCRYPYEFDGGHIPGAVNVACPSEIQAVLDADAPSSLPAVRPHVLLFHCEFSSERAPRMALHVRRQDRLSNGHRYPHLSHPHLYILDGGYRAFWQHSPERCAPPYHYRPMRDALFKPELRLHQRASKATARQRKALDKSKGKCSKDSLAVKADAVYSQSQECTGSYASSPAALTALRRAAAHQHPFFPAAASRQSGSEL